MTIDIMLPFWGDPLLLRQTVESVLGQTDPEWRLTVIDDAYPDPTVAEYFAQLDDPRVRYVRNDVNVGIIENFRASVRLATADHLVVLGSDDLLLPGYVAALRDAVRRHPDAAVFQPGVQVIDENGAPSLPLVDRVKQRMLRPDTRTGDAVLSDERLATSLTQGNWLYWPSLLFRTEAIRAHEFRDDLPIVLDLAILLDIAFAGGSLVVIDDEVFAYRRHTESASQKAILDGSRFTDDRRFFLETARRADTRGWRSTARAARARLFARLHALTTVPTVLRRGDAAGRRALWRHILR
ncbi:glycosyltransferase family 2 protein [Microbacterium galbinum]|uniref:Glycosyltransferase n=1 Tax=Microbacterium galbinum TaxID=2851646 RepID=A0ABY4ISI8_9MICO|nr:glycosyltransferase [Microbacterium galbinum]UPL15220.1 glycosyltransferase [Microbacterium galbinum]